MMQDQSALINHRYRIIEILGQGGMGAVYRALDENIGVEVALKENLFTSDEYARQFKREATILANLRHPNLPRVTDHFVIVGQGQYLVMDFIEGEDLRERMDRRGILKNEEVLEIGISICDALQYLDTRTQPIVHRDIKPGNVKISPTGHIYLVDFGLAKVVESDQITTTGARAMTPGYSPPEQYGTTRTDHRSDLYSLGATMYAAITGMVPEDALARIMGQSELTPVCKRNPDVIPLLAEAIEKSLAVRPDERFSCAAEFKQALLAAKSSLAGDIPDEMVDNVMIQTGTDSPSRPIKQQLAADDARMAVSSQPVEQLNNPRRLLYFGLVMVVLIAAVTVGIFLPRIPAFTFLAAPTTALVSSAHASEPTPLFALPSSTATPTRILFTSTPIPTKTEVSHINIPASPTSPPPTQVGGGSGLIAFASKQSGKPQIWVIDLQGNNLRQVTDMLEGACQPDWSPDGSRLVFISPCDRNDESYPGSGLFIINLDGTNLTPLPSVPGGDYDPAWSPDGKNIAFTSLRVSNRPRIYVINIDSNETIRLSGQYSRDMQPGWSWDGKWITYVSRDKGLSTIWIMKADASEKEPFSQSGFLTNTYPQISLDLDVLLFTQVEKPGGIPYLVAAAIKEDEYNESRINLGPIPAREARFSPDGLWIVFESWPDGKNHDIYIMTSSGAGRSQITNLPSFEFDPAWQPAIIFP